MGDKGPKTRVLGFTTLAHVPYLLFRVKDSVYGIHVRSVNEIVLLPELTMIAQRARQFIGVVNVRGMVVPVMDLELRFGRKSGNFSLGDYLLVLGYEDRSVALVVNDVLGVQKVAAEQLAHESTDSARIGSEDACIDRVASIDDQIVMLLDVESLFSSTAEPATEIGDASAETESLLLFASASPAEQAVFHRRAARLRQSDSTEETAEMMPLAVAEIEGEFFGFDLTYVREFFETSQVTPVPCCPQRIIGNVNLRGDILTVVNIRGQLNLPAQGLRGIGKIVVSRTDDLIVGILVDELHGVHYLPTTEITDVSCGAQSDGVAPLVGTAPYRDTLMSILDLPKLLAIENWAVDEEVGRR